MSDVMYTVGKKAGGNKVNVSGGAVAQQDSK